MMEEANWHKFQVLTKRSSRMRDYIRNRYGDYGAPTNVWLGVSIENNAKLSRVRHLAETMVAIRFLSIEPLIGPIFELPLDGIGWVIVGGESGPGARPIDPQWVRTIRDQCAARKVPFFFKQWGGLRPKSGGRVLDGREWNQWPKSPVEHFNSDVGAKSIPSTRRSSTPHGGSQNDRLDA
jgi:protein gp37